MYGGLREGLSLREIARRLKRHHTSLSDELKRNKTGVGKTARSYITHTYVPCRAQKKAEKRSCEQRKKAPLKEPFIFLYVRKHLKPPYSWSPEEISGRLSLKYPDKCINKETIYLYIYSKGARRYKLWEYLPLARKKRMKKLGRRVHRASKIPEAVSIDLRPEIVSLRKRIGDWETDNVIGKISDISALSVTVERVTKLTLVSKVGRSSEEKIDALIQRLDRFQDTIRLTLTCDNGAENTNHQEIARRIGMQVYFCHAYHSWEKGTVENTNGRIRRFIPKGMSIDSIPEKKIKQIEHILNSTPRKCLGFKTPYERMKEVRTSYTGGIRH